MKNRKFTRFCTLILAFCMILPLIPQTFPAVHAQETTQTASQSTKLDGQISAEPVIFDTVAEIETELTGGEEDE